MPVFSKTPNPFGFGSDRHFTNNIQPHRRSNSRLRDNLSNHLLDIHQDMSESLAHHDFEAPPLDARFYPAHLVQRLGILMRWSSPFDALRGICLDITESSDPAHRVLFPVRILPFRNNPNLCTIKFQGYRHVQANTRHVLTLLQILAQHYHIEPTIRGVFYQDIRVLAPDYPLSITPRLNSDVMLTNSLTVEENALGPVLINDLDRSVERLHQALTWAPESEETLLLQQWQMQAVEETDQPDITATLPLSDISLFSKWRLNSVSLLADLLAAQSETNEQSNLPSTMVDSPEPIIPINNQQLTQRQFGLWGDSSGPHIQPYYHHVGQQTPAQPTPPVDRPVHDGMAMEVGSRPSFTPTTYTLSISSTENQNLMDALDRAFADEQTEEED